MLRLEGAQHEQAAEWFVTLQEQELSVSTLQEWKRWIADPDNRESFTAIVELWSHAEALGPMSLPDSDAFAADNYDGSESLATWFARQGLMTSHAEHEGSGTAERPPQPRRWYRKLELRAAAALASMAIIGRFIYAQIWSIFTDKAQHYQTGIGEHRNIRLADGSMVELGACSALRVQLTSERRSVFIDEGEAFFDVAKNAKWPFVVQAGELQVTVVGTAFNLRKAKDSAVVSVQEGTVRVSRSEAPNVAKHGPDTSGAAYLNDAWPAVEILTQGQQVGYDPSGLSAVKSVNPEYITSWREGRRQYLYAPLNEVIGDINRYSRRLVFLDDRAHRLHFTGTIFQSNVDDFMSQLPYIFPLQIESDGGRAVLHLRNSEVGNHH